MGNDIFKSKRVTGMVPILFSLAILSANFLLPSSFFAYSH